jgi:hypothetical protein
MIRSIAATSALLLATQVAGLTFNRFSECEQYPLVGHQDGPLNGYSDLRDIVDADACCDICEGDANCEGFTWTDLIFDPTGTHCVLYDTPSDGCTPHPNCISGNPSSFQGPEPLCDAPAQECPFDGNLEVLLPPLLDENNTRVVLTATSSNMQVKIVIPSQYETVKIDFEGATDDGAAFDSTNTSTWTYWQVDALSDPCNTYLTARIPWDLFRQSLGGIEEQRFYDAVYFGTLINIESSFDLELKPETLLDEGYDGYQPPSQTHTRYVRTRIPFEVHFDLKLKLWASANVVSDHLRIASALIETSVLEVTPDQYPIAKARFEFVTVIPAPLILDYATIAVNDPDLAYGLTVHEIVSKRDCLAYAPFCTQHWQVYVEPKKCTLDGQYIATVFGKCHPDSTNCLHPNPNTAQIVMDVTSDDYCGVTQEVDIYGSLSLYRTECNGYMSGTVTVSNPYGGAINHTEIVELHVSPTLYSYDFLTVYDAANSIEILYYEASLTYPNQVDFHFLWKGSELRCDVVASVDAVVRVEFEATRTSYLLEASSRPHKQALLDDQDVRITSSASIGAAPIDSANPPAGNSPPTAAGNSGSSTSAIAAMKSPLGVGLIAGLSALLVALGVVGVVLCRRSRANKSATAPPTAPESIAESIADEEA